MFNEATMKNSINEEGWNEISDDMDAQTGYSKFKEIYLKKHYNSAHTL